MAVEMKPMLDWGWMLFSEMTGRMQEPHFVDLAPFFPGQGTGREAARVSPRINLSPGLNILGMLVFTFSRPTGRLLKPGQM